jgi:hypothetical protein
LALVGPAPVAHDQVMRSDPLRAFALGGQMRAVFIRLVAALR